MKRALISVFAAAMLIAGCTTLMPSKEAVAQGILVKVELEHATETLLALPLSENERALADAAIADFKMVSRKLDTASANFQRVLTLVENPNGVGAALLDDVVAAYMMAHLAYTSFLERTGTEPDPVLVRYDDSARVVYDELDRLMKANDDKSVNFQTLQGYLALTLRAVATMT